MRRVLINAKAWSVNENPYAKLMLIGEQKTSEGGAFFSYTIVEVVSNIV